MSFRIGNGFDVHRFGEPDSAQSIRLCGIDVPHDAGLIAHSDGDVGIHSLCDALLGALALGDIGKRFPDSNPDYSGVDSRKLLVAVMTLVREQGYRVVNADITVIAERPRIADYTDAMRQQLSELLGIGINAMSVKATTTEKAGFLGRKEAIAAQAVVLVEDV